MSRSEDPLVPYFRRMRWVRPGRVVIALCGFALALFLILPWTILEIFFYLLMNFLIFALPPWTTGRSDRRSMDWRRRRRREWRRATP